MTSTLIVALNSRIVDCCPILCWFGFHLSSSSTKEPYRHSANRTRKKTNSPLPECKSEQTPAPIAHLLVQLESLRQGGKFKDMRSPNASVRFAVPCSASSTKLFGKSSPSSPSRPLHFSLWTLHVTPYTLHLGGRSVALSHQYNAARYHCCTGAPHATQIAPCERHYQTNTNLTHHTLHLTVFSSHLAPQTSNVAVDTLYITPYTLRPTRHTFHFPPHIKQHRTFTIHDTPNTSHVTHDTIHITLYTSHRKHLHFTYVFLHVIHFTLHPPCTMSLSALLFQFAPPIVLFAHCTLHLTR